MRQSGRIGNLPRHAPSEEVYARPIPAGDVFCCHAGHAGAAGPVGKRPKFIREQFADYSTTIAQGSLFVVFGYNLGPANLVQVSAFPLPNVLAGTSVTVQSGSTTLNCPMIYTSNAQVAAILPSNTPVGVAVIAVALNGVPGYSSTEVTVGRVPKDCSQPPAAAWAQESSRRSMAG